jgi:hypothetical protein
MAVVFFQPLNNNIKCGVIYFILYVTIISSFTYAAMKLLVIYFEVMYLEQLLLVILILKNFRYHY